MFELCEFVCDSVPPFPSLGGGGVGRASGGNEVMADSGYEGFQLLDEVHDGDDNDDQGE